MNTEKELYKIKIAFEKVKSDVLHLYEKTKHLERENENLRNDLKKKQVTTKKPNKKEELYIGHKKTKKLHVNGCPYAKNIISENRVIFTTLNEALKEKYTRCSCIG